MFTKTIKNSSIMCFVFRYMHITVCGRMRFGLWQKAQEKIMRNLEECFFFVSMGLDAGFHILVHGLKGPGRIFCIQTLVIQS